MDSYVEVVGRVVDATTVNMLACINLGDDLGEYLPSWFTIHFLMLQFCYGRHETRE